MTGGGSLPSIPLGPIVSLTLSPEFHPIKLHFDQRNRYDVDSYIRLIDSKSTLNFKFAVELLATKKAVIDTETGKVKEEKKEALISVFIHFDLDFVFHAPCNEPDCLLQLGFEIGTIGAGLESSVVPDWVNDMLSFDFTEGGYEMGRIKLY